MGSARYPSVLVGIVTVGRLTIFLPGSSCSPCKCVLRYVNYDNVSYQVLYKASWAVCHFYGLCFVACRPNCGLLRQSCKKWCWWLNESFVVWVVFPLYAVMSKRRTGGCCTRGTNTGSWSMKMSDQKSYFSSAASVLWGNPSLNNYDLPSKIFYKYVNFSCLSLMAHPCSFTCSVC